MADISKLKTVLGIVKELAALQEHPTAKPMDHKYQGLFWKQDEWIREAFPIDLVDIDLVDNVDNGPSCGTAMCFAGWTAYLDGFTDVDGYERVMVNPTTGETLAMDGIEEYATDSLDLTTYQADDLFEGGNELSDLEEIIDFIAEQEKG